MQISAFTLSLTVADVAASSAFLSAHFGFQIENSDPDGNYAALGRADVAAKIVFLRRGCEVLPPNQRDLNASGLILAFTTTDLEIEESRLRAAGVSITLPLMEEAWGERLFQVTDPNGVVIQLVEWAV